MKWNHCLPSPSQQWMTTPPLYPPLLPHPIQVISISSDQSGKPLVPLPLAAEDNETCHDGCRHYSEWNVFPRTENKSWRATQLHCQKQIKTTHGPVKVETFSDNICGWYKHIYYVQKHPHPSPWTKRERMMQKIYFDQAPEQCETNNKRTLESFSQIKDLLCSWTVK